jgi:amino acid transporter
MSVIGSTVEEAYIVLLDATLILYFIPYLYLFLSLIKLRKNRENSPHPIDGMVIPGGKFGLWLVALLGFGATALSIMLSIIPPENVENRLIFELKVVGGTLAFLTVGLIFFFRGKRKKSEKVNAT